MEILELDLDLYLYLDPSRFAVEAQHAPSDADEHR